MKKSSKIKSREGFTAWQHDLDEPLMRAKLTLYQLLIVRAIGRETLGFQQEMRQISIGRIHRLTGISKRNIRRELGHLLELRVLIRHRVGGARTKNRWGFNFCVPGWLCGFRLVHSADQRSYALHSPYPMRSTAPTPMRSTAPIFREGKESRKILIKQTYREATMEMIVDNPYFSMFSKWLTRINPGQDQTAYALSAWNKYGEESIRYGLAASDRVNSNQIRVFWRAVKQRHSELKGKNKPSEEKVQPKRILNL